MSPSRIVIVTLLPASLKPLTSTIPVQGRDTCRLALIQHFSSSEYTYEWVPTPLTVHSRCDNFWPPVRAGPGKWHRKAAPLDLRTQLTR